MVQLMMQFVTVEQEYSSDTQMTKRIDISYLQEPTPNYKAEVEPIKKAAEILVDNTFTKVVIFTDALSVLQALEAEGKNLNDLSTSLTLLCQEATVVLQCIPSH